MKIRLVLVAALFVYAFAPAPPLHAQTSDGDREAEARRALERAMAAERPIEGIGSVWLEELTWMEVRDALAEGTTTVIISTGGIEQNGPHLALGKHNYILEEACEGIARKLGDALCAPIVKLVPEGEIENPTGHMRYPGTISVRQETFQSMLTDVAMSLKTHGFRDIVFIGDSGGNQDGMEAVAGEMNARWSDARAHFVPEYYRSYFEGFDLLKEEFGVEETADDGIHEDIVITSQMLTGDPVRARYLQRLEAEKASINGVSIADLHRTRTLGHAVLQHRIDATVRAIEKARGR